MYTDGYMDGWMEGRMDWLININRGMRRLASAIICLFFIMNWQWQIGKQEGIDMKYCPNLSLCFCISVSVYLSLPQTACLSSICLFVCHCLSVSICLSASLPLLLLHSVFSLFLCPHPLSSISLSYVVAHLILPQTRSFIFSFSLILSQYFLCLDASISIFVSLILSLVSHCPSGCLCLCLCLSVSLSVPATLSLHRVQAQVQKTDREWSAFDMLAI